MTGSLKTTVKLIGELPVGSAWPAAWLIVTVSGVMFADTYSTAPMSTVPLTMRGNPGRADP